MSRRLDWDAYRYILDDPTLDRQVFEARMLDDLDLALAVAEAVSHVDALRAASFIAPSPSRVMPSQVVPVASAGAESSAWRLSTLIVLAAGLLLTIGIVNYQLLTSHRFRDPSTMAAQSKLLEQSLAESWLAIRQTELVDGSTNLVDISTNVEALRDDDSLPDAVDAVGEDWLMDAAREFYAQGEAG